MSPTTIMLALCLALCINVKAVNMMGTTRRPILTHKPVVAIFGYPAMASNAECGGSCESVTASYVKWLESAGARSLPISYYASVEEVHTVLNATNALIFIGGSPPLSVGARSAIEYVIDHNNAGDFFPMWGTCLGWEWIAQTVSGDSDVVDEGYDSLNMTQPLGILTESADSRMFSELSSEIIEEATKQPLTTGNHSKGVPPEKFVETPLSDTFRIVAVNEDRVGKQYVSMVEGRDLPIYGLQWHPEKSQFEWGLDNDGTPHGVINHSHEAIQLSQGLANFFVSEARCNGHTMEDPAYWNKHMFHNRVSTPTGDLREQSYFIRFDEEQSTEVELE